MAEADVVERKGKRRAQRRHCWPEAAHCGCCWRQGRERHAQTGRSWRPWPRRRRGHVRLFLRVLPRHAWRWPRSADAPGQAEQQHAALAVGAGRVQMQMREGPSRADQRAGTREEARKQGTD
jgi:hypothetical protein